MQVENVFNEVRSLRDFSKILPEKIVVFLSCFNYIFFLLYFHFSSLFIYEADLKTTQGWPKCCTDQDARILIQKIYL